MPDDRRREVVDQLARLARNQLLVEQKVQELHEFLRRSYEDLNGELAQLVGGELLVVSDIRVAPSRGNPKFEWEVRFRGQEILGFTCQAGGDPFWPGLAANCEIREGGGRRVTAMLYLVIESSGAEWKVVEEGVGAPGARRPAKLTQDYLLDLFRRYLDTAVSPDTEG